MWILKLHITKFKIIKVTIKNNYIKKLKIKYTKINHNIIFFVLSMIIIQYTSYSAKKDSLLTVYPKQGDGIGIILKRYNIPATKEYIETFKTMNTNRLDKNSNIVLDKLYVLPIKVLPFNGVNIRTSINNSDRSIAEKVQEYNLKMKSKGLKDDFKKDKTLWLPIDNILSETFLNEEELKNSIAEKKIDNTRVSEITSNKETITNKSKEINISNDNVADSIENEKENTKNIGKANKSKINTRVKAINSIYTEPLLGKDYQDVKIVTNRLIGTTFYLDAGHGGIDPGAVGVSNNTEMHEDEYAYDVTIRLARKLIEHGADVYMIVQDKTDGIRDSKFLNNKFDEVYHGDIPITMENKQRLRTRGSIVNELYRKNEYANKRHQLVTIHVDSRITEQRIDIFFYYKNDGGKSQKTANTLLKTIENKYNKAQPGRGYKGSVTNRSLYMLNNTLPPAVYIELGNIQNQLDQVRFLEVNNRQAIANWLCDGFIEVYVSKIKIEEETEPKIKSKKKVKSKKNRS